MGDIADDIIDGCCCSICGGYFVYKANNDEGFEHGYPVACSECWDADCGYPKQDKTSITL